MVLMLYNKSSVKKSFFIYPLLVSTILLAFAFLGSLTTSAGTNPSGQLDGLPCPNGGPDYRSHMAGSFSIRFDRIGEDTRYSPGFDAAWQAQCLDPSASGALENLFSVLESDIVSGIITKCNASDTVSLDSKGNIKLCSDEADSYITITGGNWVWDYYYTSQPTSIPPTQGLPTNLGELIQQIFAWSLSILGISVFVMFFYSGFLWLTAAGNTSKIGEAKTHMTNAVFGAILLLSAYLILYTINPDFVKNTVNLPGLGTQK